VSRLQVVDLFADHLRRLKDEKRDRVAVFNRGDQDRGEPR